MRRMTRAQPLSVAGQVHPHQFQRLSAFPGHSGAYKGAQRAALSEKTAMWKALTCLWEQSFTVVLAKMPCDLRRLWHDRPAAERRMPDAPAHTPGCLVVVQRGVTTRSLSKPLSSAQCCGEAGIEARFLAIVIAPAPQSLSIAPSLAISVNLCRQKALNLIRLRGRLDGSGHLGQG